MNHTWNIFDLQRVTSTGVITKVGYECKTTWDGGYDSRTVGEIYLSGSNSDPDFIDYSNLTKDVVIGWVTSSVDTSSIYTANSQSIADNYNLDIANTSSYGFPW